MKTAPVLMLVGPATGGIAHHAKILTAELRTLGLAVTVIGSQATAAILDWQDLKAFWPGGKNSLRNLLRIRNEINRLPAGAIIHAQGIKAGILGHFYQCLAKRKQLKLVISLHNEIPENSRLGKKLLVKAFANADLVTGASTDLCRAAQKLGARRTEFAPVTSPKISEICNSHPHSAPRVPGINWDRPVVLCVARNAPQKQLGELEDIAEKLGEQAQVLLIGAEGYTSTRITSQATNPDLVQLFLHADVFVLTSKWEARALVVQEAMAAGLPVVAPAVGGLIDLLENGGGVLYPPHDTERAVSVIKNIISDAALAKKYGSQGKTQAKTFPTPAMEALGWVKRYAAITEQSAGI